MLVTISITSVEPEKAEFYLSDEILKSLILMEVIMVITILMKSMMYLYPKFPCINLTSLVPFTLNFITKVAG